MRAKSFFTPESPNIRTRTFNVSVESPPMNFNFQLSSDAETVEAIQPEEQENVENLEPRGAVGYNSNSDMSPSMRPFWESVSTQRELRRLGSYNAQGQREEQNVLTPSRLRTRLRSGAQLRPDDSQRNRRQN